MKKIMLIAGCSHAAGSEINGYEDSVYNRRHSYGANLAKHYGYQPVNIAQNGMTNSGIARSVLRWFKNHYDPVNMKVFVLVSWTESTRIEIANDRGYAYNVSSKAADWFDDTANQYMRITFGWEGGDPEERAIVPYYHKFMAQNEAFLELMTVQYMLQLQYFFKSKSVNYLMTNSLHVFSKERPQLESYFDLIDETKYYKMRDNDEAFFIKYRNLGHENSKAKYWHHDEVPHKLYAEELIKYIEEMKWQL